VVSGSLLKLSRPGDFAHMQLWQMHDSYFHDF
jgi:hypothetical protein